MCSLIGQPVAAADAKQSSDTSDKVRNRSDSIAPAQLAGISQNVRKLSSSHTIYRIVKAAYTHMGDVIVLEWGLRVVHFIAVEEGEWTL
jgi:hypothetical protein